MDDSAYPLLANRTLAVFFSLGVSLQRWHDAGLIEREVAPYNRMARLLHTVYFLTYGDQRDLVHQAGLVPDVRVVARNVSLPPALYALAMLFSHRSILRQADLFKTLQISGAWAALPAKFLFRKPLLVRCGYQCSLNYRRKISATTGRLRIVFLLLYTVYTVLEWAAYHAADLIIVTSELDRRYVVSRYHVNPAKIHLLPNAIDVNVFRPMPEIRAERRRLCFVGRLTPEKNLFNLLDAVSGQDVELVVFGDGVLRDALQRHAATRGIRNVTFRGRVPNSALPAELNRSAAFLLVSHYEGNPKALLEAMSCGLPVIGSDVDGIREIITHQETGYLCAPTAEGIRDAIQAVLGDPARAEAMGRQARRTVVEGYSLDALLTRELELLQESLR
jgi:glycosyltransferase involved in cell wall biosynthesis